MKKTSLIIVVLIFTVINAYCQRETVVTSQNVNVSSASTNNIDESNLNIRIMPMVAEYKILTTEAVYDSIDTKTPTKNISNNVKLAIDTYQKVVEAQIIKRYKADAIFSPTRETYTSKEGNLVVIVRGYPVKYVNFRNASNEDVKLLQQYDATKIIPKNSDLKIMKTQNIKED